MQTRKFNVEFDNGPTIEVSFKSRDLAVLERDGVDLQETPRYRTTYLIALTALRRMSAAGEIDIELPADVDALIDSADIAPTEDADDEGEGSGQEAEPGSPLN